MRTPGKPTVRWFTSAREGREGHAQPQGERARPVVGVAPRLLEGEGTSWRVETGDSRGKASMGGGSGVGAGAGTANSPPPFKANPMHIKYRAYTTGDDPNVDLKVRQCAKRLCRMSPHLSAVFSAARDRLEDLDARIARPDQSRRALSFLERGVLLPASPVVSPRARRLPRYFQNPLASQKTATQHLRDLENPPDKLTGQRQTPEIIEFLNICDYTHQVVSKVDVEEPLFQPFPPELGFHKYAPRKQYEQTLWFRNNDYVPRRIRIEDPRSRHFTVRRMRGKKGEKLREETEGKSSKVAPGMEVAFKVTFSPWTSKTTLWTSWSPPSANDSSCPCAAAATSPRSISRTR